MTVFEFEIYDPNTQTQNSTRNLDKAPQVADSPAPAAPTPVPATSVAPEAPVAPAPTAEDACPF